MKQFEEEKVKWEQQRQAAAQAGKAFDDAEPTMDEERERAWQVKKVFKKPVHPYRGMSPRTTLACCGKLACERGGGVLQSIWRLDH